MKNFGHSVFHIWEYRSSPYMGFALSGVLRAKGSAGGPGGGAHTLPPGPQYPAALAVTEVSAAEKDGLQSPRQPQLRK